MKYFITYDVGTSNLKTALYRIGDGNEVECVGFNQYGYPLDYEDNDAVSQHEDNWWNAACKGTRQLLDTTEVDACDIQAVTFCCQMGAVIAVDKDGNTLLPPISLIDDRAKEEFKNIFCGGVLRSEGRNLFKLLEFITRARYVPYTSKDFVWKYLWIKKHKPDVFDRIYKFLDVNDWFILKSTGRFVRVLDNAYTTGFLNCKKLDWDSHLCHKYGVDLKHLPDIVKSTDIMGYILPHAAAELGLCQGTVVVAGAADTSCIPLGVGHCREGQCAIYCGTSGMVETVTTKLKINPFINSGSLRGVCEGIYNFSSEIAVAGKCFDSYLKLLSPDEKISSRLSKFDAEIGDVPAGCNGMILAPWVQGIKSPVSNSDIGATMVGFRLGMSEPYLARAIAEGLCLQFRWVIESQEKATKLDRDLKFVGGTANSQIICKILSDVLGRKVVVPDNPQLIGCLGALGIVNKALDIGADITKGQTFSAYNPDPKAHEIYNRSFKTFRRLYSMAANL